MRKLVFCLAALSLCHAASREKWGDQADGTFVNPVMPGDFSDLDAIRLGDRYYAISSTLQYSPGVLVLESRDLVNWKIIGHVVQDLTQIGPELNWDRMDRAGRGVWAGSLRFHDGKFRVYFTTPDEGIFMSTAVNPAGPWTPLKALWRVAGWDDPCPFWDDDGQAYLIATNFAADPVTGKSYNIHLFKMDAAGERLIPGSDRILYRSQGSEANKLYKINGTYFHFFSEVHREGRVPMMRRARSLEGPWEMRQLLHVHPAIDKEPNQGGLIRTPSGSWYFLTHQGTGDWEGRAGALLPVTWIAGWPIIGKSGRDGIGNMLWQARKPVSGFPKTRLWASDDFRQGVLRPEWEWNYQPRSEMWSLNERPGCLRLHAFAPLKKGDFRSIGNVLSQRAMRTRSNTVTALFNVADMADGEEAGLAHYGRTYSALAVARHKGVSRLVLDSDGGRQEGQLVQQRRLWLRSRWGFDGRSQFSYSLDGSHFKEVGEPYQLTWGAYRGDRIGLFTSNSERDAGYVEIEQFRYEAVW